MKFGKNNLKIIWKWHRYMSFKYFGSYWCDTNWSGIYYYYYYYYYYYFGTSIKTDVILANSEDAGNFKDKIASLNWAFLFF